MAKAERPSQQIRCKPTDGSAADNLAAEPVVACITLVYVALFCEVVEMNKKHTLTAQALCRADLEEISESGGIALLEDCDLSVKQRHNLTRSRVEITL